MPFCPSFPAFPIFEGSFTCAAKKAQLHHAVLYAQSGLPRKKLVSLHTSLLHQLPVDGIADAGVKDPLYVESADVKDSLQEVREILSVRPAGETSGHGTDG